jgi:hypothetical protein
MTRIAYMHPLISIIVLHIGFMGRESRNQEARQRKYRISRTPTFLAVLNAFDLLIEDIDM